MQPCLLPDLGVVQRRVLVTSSGPLVSAACPECANAARSLASEPPQVPDSELWRHQHGAFNMLPGFGVGEDMHVVIVNLDWHVGLVVGVVVLRRGLFAPLLLPVGGDLV